MSLFEALFGRAPTVVAQAPGRVNLIGEHTDYNGGYVLPTAIPPCSRVELAPRSDLRVRVASTTCGDPGAIAEYALGDEAPGRGWIDYVQGCTATLARAGHRLRGFEACITSTVPVGAGVSSSAALEVSVLRALRAAFALPLDDVTLALIGHRAECDFVGARVGVMDQMAASLADETTALFLDTATLRTERIPIPGVLEVVVIDSGIPHQHASGGYNARRAECERAAALLGVQRLRELSVDDLPRAAALPPPLDRRVRHVVTENARVLEAVATLRGGDAVYLGTLLYEGHVSLRDDYEVSLPEIDILVELARADGGVYGARLTGGGFGGAVVILAHAGDARGVAERVARAYLGRTGRRATVLVAGRAALPA